MAIAVFKINDILNLTKIGLVIVGELIGGEVIGGDFIRLIIDQSEYLTKINSVEYIDNVLERTVQIGLRIESKLNQTDLKTVIGQTFDIVKINITE